MIEGLDNVLEGTGLPGVGELRELLRELLLGNAREGRLIDQQSLQKRPQRVFRLRFDMDGETHSVVVKRLKPEIELRNRWVARRWLPAIGLSNCGPPLLGVAAARSGLCVWHVYEDLGDHELDPHALDRQRVAAAVDLIAKIHTRFAGHALLGEVRLHGGDLGIHFYDTNVRDAIAALEPLRGTAVRDRLLERLYKLRDELPERADALAKWAGQETLLHGDLWAINVFVLPDQRVRLIDWDHAAVGPATYDLSTFLLRFPAEHRPWVLELYRNAGCRLPGQRELNFLFETHEYARFANRIIWPAIAMGIDNADWGVEELNEIERWFEAFKPVLPAAMEVAA
jgi:hypothetical protein